MRNATNCSCEEVNSWGERTNGNARLRRENMLQFDTTTRRRGFFCYLLVGVVVVGCSRGAGLMMVMDKMMLQRGKVESWFNDVIELYGKFSRSNASVVEGNEIWSRVEKRVGVMLKRRVRMEMRNKSWKVKDMVWEGMVEWGFRKSSRIVHFFNRRCGIGGQKRYLDGVQVVWRWNWLKGGWSKVLKVRQKIKEHQKIELWRLDEVSKMRPEGENESSRKNIIFWRNFVGSWLDLKFSENGKIQNEFIEPFV